MLIVAVYGRQFLINPVGLWCRLLISTQINDIGPAGKARVARDIQRCEYVLKELGMNLIDIKQEH